MYSIAYQKTREIISSMPPVTPASALVGRDSEMALLTELVKEVSAGRGSPVLIEGEPGIGKSWLVRAVLAGTPDAGGQVFWGAGDELGQALPLLPFLDGLGVREPSTNPRPSTIAGSCAVGCADRGAHQPRGPALPAASTVTAQDLLNARRPVGTVRFLVDTGGPRG
jgi:predicted ATPase